MLLALAAKVQAGLRVRGIPTSRETAEVARRSGIPLVQGSPDWDGVCPIDVAIDGADQVDPHLNLIKGGGGALLKEKIVASAARQLIVVVDQSKQVPVLGGAMPLPIEVVCFGWTATARAIEALGGKTKLRERDGRPFLTEAGHYIVDFSVDRIDDPAALQTELILIPGVVETGLFVDRTSLLLVGTAHGVQRREPGTP